MRDIFGHPRITFLSKKRTISFSHIGWHFFQILWWWSVWRVMIIFSRAIARKAHAAGAQMSFGLKAAWLTQNWQHFLMNRCFCSFPLDFDCMILRIYSPGSLQRVSSFYQTYRFIRSSFHWRQYTNFDVIDTVFFSVNNLSLAKIKLRTYQHIFGHFNAWV